MAILNDYQLRHPDGFVHHFISYAELRRYADEQGEVMRGVKVWLVTREGAQFIGEL